MPIRTLSPRTLRRAFTLVELLVVLGICALLISILLPTLSRARKSAIAVKLAADERQAHLHSLANQPPTTTAPTTPPPQPRLASVTSFSSKVDLTPRLSVGTAEPESIYEAKFTAKLQAHSPTQDPALSTQDSQACELHLPLPPHIISPPDPPLTTNNPPPPPLPPPAPPPPSPAPLPPPPPADHLPRRPLHHHQQLPRRLHHPPRLLPRLDRPPPAHPHPHRNHLHRSRQRPLRPPNPTRQNPGHLRPPTHRQRLRHPHARTLPPATQRLPHRRPDQVHLELQAPRLRPTHSARRPGHRPHRPPRRNPLARPTLRHRLRHPR